MIEEEEYSKYTKFDNNKKEIFAQLKDLFGELVTSDTLNDICLKHNWQVESCINDTINYIENSKKDKIADSNDKDCFFSQKMMNETKMMNYQYNSADDVVIESEEISSIPPPVPDTEGNSLPIPIEPSMQERKLGAIPKVGNNQCRTINYNFIGDSDENSLELSKIIQQGLKMFENTPSPYFSNRKREENAINSLEVQNIIKNIQLGYKIMIIMRGPPGCGKSFLAKHIVSQTIGNDFRNYIFSSDDYFYNVNDQYVYDRTKIHLAHDFNQKRVRKKALEGWSPIIVDNTNTKIWEFVPYAQIAVQNGYVIHILYPENDWCNSVNKLFARNHHGVPKETIKRMLDGYEPCSVDQLLKASGMKYSVPIPQYRHFPALKKGLFTNDQILKSFNTSNIFEEEDKTKSVADNTDSEHLKNEGDIQKETSIKLSNVESLNSIPIWPEFRGFKGIGGVKKLNVNEQNEIKIDEAKSEAKLTDLKVGIFNVELNESISGIVNSDQWTNYEKTSDNCVEDTKEDDNSSKPQRNNSRTRRHYLKNIEPFDETIVIPEVKDSEWKNYEEESKDFWSSNQENDQGEQQKQKKLDSIDFLSSEPKPKRNLNKTTENLISVLKETNENNIENHNKNINENSSINTLEKHKLGCPNESKSFVMLRQIYQNKQLDGLWDLFEKCNGDVYWAVDILIKDDDTCIDQQVENRLNLDQYFVCHCDEISDEKILKENQEKESTPSDNLQRNKVKKDKNSTSSSEMLKAKRAIEKQFVLAEQYYSEHVKKIRDFRHGIENNNQNSQNVTPATTVDVATIESNTFQLDNPSNDIHTNDNMDIENEIEAEEIFVSDTEDLVEVDLGKDLVQQLDTIFNRDTNVNIPFSEFKTNVFMPKSLAQQLHAIWMESLYNQMEEQKQTMIKEDEELARFLQTPVKTTVSSDPEPPKTLKEVMEMELAWSIYKSNTENWKKYLPKDLASILTRQKLFEMYPNIEKDTLCQILNANGNKFGDTIKDLQNSLKSDLDEDIQEKAVDLLKKAKDESEMNSKNTQMQSKQNQPRRSQITTEEEEAKKSALKDFEENRNLAAHHTQLKAECYRRAKDAIQGKAHGIAMYYSQIANLHKSKIDKYNQTAANCIMEIQNLNQNNPDLIDLHYLHVMEAVECLDVFIDKQISELKRISKRYKFIFIITGRGLHSTGGISAIKNKVKGRLKERCLTWSEVNPGLLKVKIYFTSRYSENF